eukprot:CAMPEP_0174717820 /NCGR_PEP_ID=MMETSP1094-20130205/27302_1 /TAXON_ID=156173 /ORGANISM="Chrysochromulina brevifilum, Strain UTEX LB 985" /LENGTH=170 /DNA_ID=CAMNT_0015917819 /DNA_START=129 /DNA_END=638 /DNA_ORIENTATION=-
MTSLSWNDVIRRYAASPEPDGAGEALPPGLRVRPEVEVELAGTGIPSCMPPIKSDATPYLLAMPPPHFRAKVHSLRVQAVSMQRAVQRVRSLRCGRRHAVPFHTLQHALLSPGVISIWLKQRPSAHIAAEVSMLLSNATVETEMESTLAETDFDIPSGESDVDDANAQGG